MLTWFAEPHVGGAACPHDIVMAALALEGVAKVAARGFTRQGRGKLATPRGMQMITLARATLTSRPAAARTMAGAER